MVQAVGLLVGYLVLGAPGKILFMIIGSIVSLLIGFVIQFIFMNLDYARTERVQFEDDEYYYYVKAVPKMAVSAPAKSVKKINVQTRPHTSNTRPVETNRRSETTMSNRSMTIGNSEAVQEADALSDLADDFEELF